MITQRPSWDEYFIGMLDQISSRNTCERRTVGAILINERKRIIATGFNGAPPGLAHCSELGGCLRAKLNVPSGERHEICRAVHAEENCIFQCAVEGRSTLGCTLYCTTFPCSKCTKAILSVGIEKVIFIQPYDDELSFSLFAESKVILLQYNKSLGTFTNPLENIKSFMYKVADK